MGVLEEREAALLGIGLAFILLLSEQFKSLFESSFDRIAESEINLSRQLGKFQKEMVSIILEPELLLHEMSEEKAKRFFRQFLVSSYGVDERVSAGFEQFLEANQRENRRYYHDVRWDVTLSDDKDPDYFLIKSRTRMRKKLTGGSFSMSCFSDFENQAEKKRQNDPADFCWNFFGPQGDTSVRESSFELLEVVVDGHRLRLSSRATDSGERIVYESDDFEKYNIKCAEDGLCDFDFTFKVRQATNASSFSAGVRGPTNRLNVKVDYKNLTASHMKHYAKLAGSYGLSPRVTKSETERTYECEMLGWIMVGSGIVFVWGK